MSLCVTLVCVGILKPLPPPFFEINHIGKGLSGKEYNICTKAGETMAFDCVLCENHDIGRIAEGFRPGLETPGYISGFDCIIPWLND